MSGLLQRARALAGAMGAGVLAAVLLTGSADAATHSGVTMPDTLRIGGETLTLNGMALRKKLIFKVYVAGLYLPERETDAERLLQSDTARHIVMEFVRSVGVDKINDAWIDGLEDNTADPSAKLRAEFATLCEWMEDIEKGRQIALSYRPGSGTQVLVKGQIKGVIEGKEFADALFACFVGPDPGPGEGFKRNLMGAE